MDTKKIIGLCLLLTAILLFSCNRSKDKGNYHFYGRITERVTGAPVPGALVYVIEDFDVGHLERVRYGDVYTNSNGEYEFNTGLRHHAERSVAVVMEHPTTGVNGIAIPGIEEENHYDLAVGSVSRLRFLVSNQTPFDANDSLYDFYIERPTGRQYVIPATSAYAGTSVNRIDTTSFFGFTSSVVHYSVKKNHIVQQFTDTILTPDPYAIITLTDTIHY